MKTPLRCRTLLFDFDGVLVDSMQLKARAFASLFESESEETINRVVAHHLAHGGMPRSEKIRHYYAQYLGRPLSREDLGRLCDNFADLVTDAVINAPAIAGAQAFLKRWHGTLECHVVSAAPEAELRHIIEGRGWTAFFRTISGSPRQKADAIEKVLSDYSLSPEEALFFGDALADFKAAQLTGVHFIALAPDVDSPLADCRDAALRIADFNDVGLQTWMTGHQ